MASTRSTLAHLTALALATAAIASGLGDTIPRTRALAQVPQTPETFPIPGELPADAVLNLDGSPSMAVANEVFRQRFVRQFPNARVELQSSRTDEALQRLINGDLDVVAAGRSLTDAERAAGLTEIPLAREKIAIIVGPDNGFAGDLTFEQFAQMFLGGINNWSAVGGPDVPLRFVDRPDHSDTRYALSQYAIFAERPFTPGATVNPVGDDTTDAVVAALGNDGIGYAVVSQVQGRDDVRILSMHETFPDDPRYPYSQPRYYVYNSRNPSPAVLAFLGFVTTEPGQEVFAAGAAAAGTATGATAPDPNTAGATGTGVDGATAGAAGATAGAAGATAGAAGAGADGAAGAGADETAETGVDGAAAGTGGVGGAAPSDPAAVDDLIARDGRTEGEGRFPWWLLGIPILGGLLWWLLKSKGAAPVAAPLIAGVVDDEPSRIILTPRNCRRAYAYWEVPDAYRAQERDRGGRNLMLRLFEVTDRDTERHPPVRIEQFAVTEDQQDLHVPIPVDDRDYQVELGYVTGENHWLPLAKSDPVRVPACPVGEGVSAGGLPVVEPVVEPVAEPVVEPAAEPIAEPVPMAVPGAAIAGGAALAGAAAVAGLLGRDGAVPEPSRIILTPRRADQGYAYWEVPEEAKAAAKREGGAQYQLRIYDAADPNQHPAPSAAMYDLGELDQDRFVPLPQGDRDYVAEIGYATVEGDWKLLARSEPVHIPGSKPEVAPLADIPFAADTPFVESAADVDAVEVPPVEPPVTHISAAGAMPFGLGGVAGIGAAAAIAATEPPSAAAVPPAPVTASHDCTIQTLTVHSRHNAVLLDGGQMEYLQNQVAATYDLGPGSYILRLRQGHFNYGDPSHPGEPWVLLWIYGGQVTNLKTNAKVNATWSTLNGYADTLSLEVDEPARLCAFFVDTFPDDNLGEVTLSIVQL